MALNMNILKGEIFLTVDIIAGLVLAEIIIRLRLADIIMKRFIPKDIPAVTGLAVAVSAGSSKAGAAILSSALEKNEINEKTALWSVLMLPLPAYLRRWPSTFALSVSMAGLAGGIFAASLLVRSVLRFVIALIFLRRENFNCQPVPLNLSPKISHRFALSVAKKLAKTLPLAWLLFAVSYSIVPAADEFLRSLFSGSLKIKILPLSGWTVAAASLAHVRAALSLTGGAIESGELGVTQAVFALVLGSGLGTVSRILRQNAGYYYGFFPKKTATIMLAMNFATIIPLIILNLLFAGLALSLWP